jgi:broad specificity phosphatase PhoE
VLRYWSRADPAYTDGPDTESFQQFIERVRTARDRLQATMETVAVFSHHQFICALLWLSRQETLPICAQTMRDFKNFLDTCPLANGAIVRVQCERGSEPWYPEVMTSHLDAMDTAQFV